MVLSIEINWSVMEIQNITGDRVEMPVKRRSTGDIESLQLTTILKQQAYRLIIFTTRCRNMKRCAALYQYPLNQSTFVLYNVLAVLVNTINICPSRYKELDHAQVVLICSDLLG